jgi:hypothetical protein
MKSADLHPQAHIFFSRRRQLCRSIGGKRETRYGTGAKIAPSTRHLTTRWNIVPIRGDQRSESSARSARRGRGSGRATRCLTADRLSLVLSK